MPRTRLVFGFFFKLVLLYALLILPWPGVRQGYVTLYCGAGNLLFRTFGSFGRVYFSVVDPPPTTGDANDMHLVLENVKLSARSAPLERNARTDGYLPTAFAVSLILATPLPWKRRFLAACWGALGMSAFAALKMALLLLENFSGEGAGAVLTFHPWVHAALHALFLIISMSPVTAYIAPIFVWLLFTFRRSDVLAFAAPSPTSTARGGHGT